MLSNPPASLRRRLIAQINDVLAFLLSSLLFSAIFFTVIIISRLVSGHSESALSVLLNANFFFAPLLLAFVFAAWRYSKSLASPQRATIGKRRLGIYVTCSENDMPVARGQALARFLACYLPVLLMFVVTEYAGLAMVNQYAQKTESPHTKQLMDSYIAKMNANKQPTPEETAAAMEITKDLAPSMGYLYLDEAVKFLVIGYYLAMIFMIAFTKDKRGPHDLICKTCVLKGNPQST